MKKRNLLIACLVCITLLSCKCKNSQAPQKETPQASIDHIVFLWLQDSTDTALLDSIKLNSQRLDTIPGIISLTMGDAIESERPIVDDSFDLGLIFTFANTREMNEYISHPGHVDFVKKWVKPNSKKLLIYDIKR